MLYITLYKQSYQFFRAYIHNERSVTLKLSRYLIGGKKHMMIDKRKQPSSQHSEFPTDSDFRIKIKSELNLVEAWKTENLIDDY